LEDVNADLDVGDLLFAFRVVGVGLHVGVGVSLALDNTASLRRVTKPFPTHSLRAKPCKTSFRIR
jgi:hypothetical protein